MVEQDHVAAIIDGSDVSFAWAKFVQQHGVPVIEANLSNTVGFSNPDFFPVGQTINTLAPAIAGASLTAIDLIESSEELRARLVENTGWFRSEMTSAGFDILPGDHPIVPVIIGDAALATEMADSLLRRGIYVIGFSFPVVPRGQARIRVQLSAAHERGDLERAVAAFEEVRAELG
jgi:histidinol-phosphate/aromatic aminotransferase/cobyric acid decarboxylase-like protein